MQISIYLDVVFIENVLMNYIIVFACGLVLKIDTKKWRILASSCLGAVYTIIMYLNIIPIYSNLAMKLLLSIVMVYVAFNPKSVKKMFKELLIFYLVSFVFGGCIFALMYFLKPQMVQIRNGVYVGSYPLKVAIIGGLIAFIVIQLAFKIVKTKLSKKDMIYKIRIQIENEYIELHALLDTGNLLKEPITGFPVVIVEKESLKDFFPKEILNNLNKIIGGDTDELINSDSFLKFYSRFRMIPFSSVGKQNGILLGIRSDSVNVIVDEQNKVTQNVIIGIYDKSFTKNEMYSAIFGLDILEGGKLNESISNVKI